MREAKECTWLVPIRGIYRQIGTLPRPMICVADCAVTLGVDPSMWPKDTSAKSGRPKDGSDSIWRDERFVRVWAAFTLSQLGSSITIVVLPLIATTALHASTLQIGMLGTANTLPFLLLGPLVGVLADRLPRRAIVITADIVRAIILAIAVVIISKRTFSGIGLLYVVAFGIGAANVWLRILTLRLAAWHLVVGAVQSLLVLFLVRQLHLTPASIGAVLSVVGFGTVLAALTASTLSARIGIGPTIMACNVAAAVASA